MKETLVIGLYEDTGQTFTSITKTTDNGVAYAQEFVGGGDDDSTA